MAKLYFRYGAMGSSKTANALMVEYNYRERGQKALLVKPETDTRNIGVVSSRIGLSKPCIYMRELMKMHDCELNEYNAVVVDEAQFCTKEEVEFLAHIVDFVHIPVMCYGLRSDFQGNLFEGSKWLLTMADEIEELKTVCWCGESAMYNARIKPNGRIAKEGEQIEVGGNERYTSLCRKHFNIGAVKYKDLEQYQYIMPEIRFYLQRENETSVKYRYAVEPNDVTREQLYQIVRILVDDYADKRPNSPWILKTRDTVYVPIQDMNAMHKACLKVLGSAK